MGYSLRMMAHFQSGLISRIFGRFWSGFFHKTTKNHLYSGFSHVSWNFNF